MFFRMLKKDLKDSPGLNIFIFLAMIGCAILTVAGAIQIYASIFGFNKSYKKANSTDIFMVTAQPVDEEEKKHEQVENWLNQKEEIQFFNCTQMIFMSPDNIKINGESFSNTIGLATLPSYLIKQPEKTNLVFNLEDETFKVSNGTVAIPQNLQSFYKINVGDKIRFITQLGNIYEFTVSTIFKDSSIYMYYRFILSDQDYDFIASESPVKLNNYEIKSTKFSDVNIAQGIFADYEKSEQWEKFVTQFNSVNFEGSKLMTSIVAILCAGIAVFLILIVAMTLRFTLTSIIKREEKRLGTLRAIGVNSFSFKWLFAAKFISFSIVSGILGAIAGIPLTNLLLDSVMINILKPNPQVEVFIGIGAGCINVLLIFFFIFRALKKIDKITIISAIHGEKQSERFGKIPGLELPKCKKIKLPLYLALTDIFGRFKRYIFLAFSYVFGFAIILLVFQLKSTVISWDFLQKTQLMGKFDFYIDLPNAEFEKYGLKTDGTLRGINEKINEELRQNNIPAFIETFSFSEGSLIIDDNEYLAGLVYGLKDTSKLLYKKGTYCPQKENEVAMNYLFAKKLGINLGDSVLVKYKKKTENELDYVEVVEPFIVTGFSDTCSNAVILIMSSKKNDIYPIQIISSQQNSGRIASCEIYAEGEEKDFYFTKIQELYGAENVRSGDEYFGDLWKDANTGIFNFLKIFISLIVLLVMILNTALYEQIFIEEEASDIALLKTIGFSNLSIKSWHYIRILLLVVSGFIVGAIVTATAGNALLERAIHVLMYASGFHLIVNPLVEYLILPAVLIAVISFVLQFSFKYINSIFVWRIKDE